MKGEEAFLFLPFINKKSNYSYDSGNSSTSIIRGTEVDLQAALDLETACFGNAFASKDRVEGMKSFVEKRKPQFVGR
ncbi:hypothetical protein V7112_18130 [Bacillus sp. JJ1566]|uniref:hypothetical protein n=1 Tax=Bacillus sp. JJ1566 TaxID=3122961 RepID=UPI002FFDAB20